MATNIDQQRILLETNLASLHCYDELASTNDTARQLEHGVSPALVIAKVQSAGRGQRSNLWWSTADSLKCSWIVNLTIEQPQLIAIAAAVATANAISKLDAHLQPRIKWPNDIYLHGKKVAGILVESHSPAGNSPSTRFVVGVGINTNCDMKLAPVEIQNQATSIACVLELIVDQDALTIDLVNELDLQTGKLQSQPENLLQSYREKSLLQEGQKLVITPAGKPSAEAIYRGLGVHGEIIVQHGSSLATYRSATISEFL